MKNDRADGILLFNPNKVELNSKKIKIIFSPVKSYNEIAYHLNEWGLREGTDFFSETRKKCCF